jgi:hypothetical protein
MGMNGTTHDTQVAIYAVGDSSDFSTFTILGANDDAPDCDPASVGASQYASYVEINCLVAGDKYWFLVDGWQGSEGIAGMVLTEVPSTPLTLASDAVRDPQCGDNGGAIFVNVTGGGPPYDISWSTGATDTLQLDGLTDGTYTISVMDACDSTVTNSYTLSSPIAAPLLANAGSDQAICFGEEVALGGGVNGSGGDNTGSGGTPDLGPNAYGIALTTTGGLLLNSSVEDNDQYVALGGAALPFDDLITMDFAFGNILFAINESSNELIAITPDATNPTASVIGVMTPVTPDHRFLNLSFDEVTQTMYAISYDSENLGSQLYTVDVSSGAATPTVAIPLNLIVASAFDIAGTLHVIDLTDNNLYTVDLATGAPTLVGNTGVNIRFINVNDMDFEPTTDRLFLSAYTDEGNVIREIDLTTGLALPLGFVGTATVPDGILLGGFAIAPPESTDDFYDYAWSPLVSSTPITTTYSLTVTDACGVTATDTILVTVNEPPMLLASSTPDNGTGNGSVTASVVTGAAGTYQYAWADSAGGSIGTDSTITGLESGWYYVLVTDENGCSATDSALVSTNVGIADLLDTQLHVYPNPSNGMVSIQIELANVDQLQVSLVDMLGKVVWKSGEQKTRSFEQSVDFSLLSKGVYQIVAQTSKGHAITRLILN